MSVSGLQPWVCHAYHYSLRCTDGPPHSWRCITPSSQTEWRRLWGPQEWGWTKLEKQERWNKKLHTFKKDKSPHHRATGANYKRYCFINQRAASHSPFQACATQSESLVRRGKSVQIIASVASAPPRPAGATCKVVVIGAATGAWRI